jgi:hypothetical protein
MRNYFDEISLIHVVTVFASKESTAQVFLPVSLKISVFIALMLLFLQLVTELGNLTKKSRSIGVAGIRVEDLLEAKAAALSVCHLVPEGVVHRRSV